MLEEEWSEFHLRPEGLGAEHSVGSGVDSDSNPAAESL